MPENVQAAAALRAVLKSQYHAALAMLRQALELCPDALWAENSHAMPYWRIAYHALYFTHFYLQPRAEDFRPWARHQTEIQYLDSYPAPPEIEALCELPHRPPQTGVPYSKADLLEYWSECDAMIDGGVDALDLTAAQSGFRWYKVSKLEHQLINLRHVQHHTAQLADRLRAGGDMGVDWVSSRPG